MSVTQKRLEQQKRKEKQAQRQLEFELDNRKVVAYARVSTSKQETEGYGLDSQLSKIADYANKHSLIIDTVYQEAFTGKTNDREQFNKLEQAVKNNQVKTLITYKLDRLGRSQLNVLGFVDLLKKYNVKLITLEPEIDYTSQAGQIILSNLTMFAQIERNMICDRTDSGRVQKFKSGSKCQGFILGYANDKKTKRFEKVESEAKRVYHIFREYLNSKSIRSLADNLNAEGFTTKRGKEFNNANLYCILTNRFYLGYASYRGEEKKGSQEPIVSEELFGRVQAKLERQRKVKRDIAI